jgi:hypothetical protein
MADPDRVAALSQQLVQVHQALREQLAAVRAQGSRDLLSHCLAFCAAVRTHHAGEDTQLFPALRAAAPELAPVIDKLIEDHGLVAGILRRIDELADAGALARELDGLTAILESHFGFEERRLARALDELGPAAWTADVFTVSGTPPSSSR